MSSADIYFLLIGIRSQDPRTDRIDQTVAGGKLMLFFYLFFISPIFLMVIPSTVFFGGTGMIY